MNPTLRLRMLQLHRWTGLTLGLLLLFLACTGLALQFREPLHSAVQPAALNIPACEKPLPLDAQIAAARAAHQTGRYEVVLLSGAGAAPTLVRFTDNAALFVDPCSASVLHEQARWGGVFGRIEQLHRFRFLDDLKLANLIGGSAAIAMALLLVGVGVALWWPVRGVPLKSAARLRPHLSGRAWDLNLHKVLGVWVGIVLVGVALTSMPLAFPWARTVINTVVGSAEPLPKPTAQPPTPDAKQLKMGVLWERARAVLDHPESAVLTYPRKKGDAVEIYAIERGAPHHQARSYVYLDAYSGEVLRADPYSASSLGNKIYRTAGAIHGGEYGVVLQVLEFLGVLGVPVLAFTGVRSWWRGRRRKVSPGPQHTLTVKVASVRQEAVGICSLQLESASGEQLPEFEAGAHVDVHLGPGLVRPYSLCSEPADRSRYIIAVKRTADSRGGSRAVHEQIRAGGLLEISAPRNKFPLRPEAEQHLLLGAGIGITPLLAMAHQLLHERRPFALHYFTHSLEHTPFLELLGQPHFERHVHLYAALERDQARRRLRTLLAHREEGSHLYLCGPEGFTQEACKLASGAWPADSVHKEHFRGDSQALAGVQQPFEVQLRKSGRRLLVPAGRSIADVLSDGGVPVPTSCREGVCGTCVTRVIAGECDHRDAFLSPAERQAHDRIMVCVSRAHSRELVLDV